MIDGYAERVALAVAEAVTLVSKACREECARPVCEDLEDVLMALLDEAGEAEQVTPITPRVVGAAAEELRKAAKTLGSRDCMSPAKLLEEAAALLEEALSP